MKNILMVIPTLRMGGAEKSVVSLLKALDPGRVRVDLLLFEGGGALAGEVPGWVNVIEADPVTRGMLLEIRYHLRPMLLSGHPAAAAARVWMTVRAALRQKLGLPPAFSWKTARRFIPALEKRYDAAVGCLEGVTDFYVLDKVRADRKVGWVHTDLSKRNNPPQDGVYYARFDAMATISDICLEAFRKAFPEAGKQMRVVENIVLPQDVRAKAAAPAAQWDTDRIHLITVGRLDHHKGIDVAARACKVLKDRGVDVCWHVYGEGVMREEITRYVQQNGLEKHFVLEGLADNPYPYMKKAHLLVQPSRLEGKSLVLDEAKILGKAIVVTNYPSVADQIEDGVTGVITGMEPEQIAGGIRRVLDDPALKQTLEENCLREPNRSIRAVNAFYEMIGA